jgi:hypothetical protein
MVMKVPKASALLLALILVLASVGRTEIIVRLEATADRVPVHLEPSERSPVVESLPRGTVVRLASPLKFRTHWYYILFASSRSGRTLSGYVLSGLVRKLNSTLKVIDLTPAEPEIAAPEELDLANVRLPQVIWGMTGSGIQKIEGRPLGREMSGDMEFLRYHRDVLGKRTLVTYVLIGQRLASVRLCLLERYADKDRYVADYNAIREFLNTKIGEPRYDNVVWKDRAYAARGENLGTAITSGTLSLSSEWAYRDMAVRLSLSAENSEILFAAEINELRAKNPASF